MRYMLANPITSWRDHWRAVHMMRGEEDEGRGGALGPKILAWAMAGLALALTYQLCVRT